MEFQDETKLKAAFAALLLRTPAEPFVAGLALFPNETARALWVATHWMNDDIVKAEMKRLRNAGADLDDLPNEADLLRTVWEMTQRGMLDDRVKAAKLYADIRGYISKGPAVAVNVSNNRVMVIRDQGTNEEWEAKVAKQQANLLDAAATRH